MSIKRTKAEYILGFAIGVFFLALGIYGIYHLLAVELPQDISVDFLSLQ